LFFHNLLFFLIASSRGTMSHFQTPQFQDTNNERSKREPNDEPETRMRYERSGGLQELLRNRWGDDNNPEPNRELEAHPRNRWGDDRRRESSRELDDRPRDRWDDEPRAQRDYAGDRERSFSDQDDEYDN
jgi:hypothetical protein